MADETQVANDVTFRDDPWGGQNSSNTTLNEDFLEGIKSTGGVFPIGVYSFELKEVYKNMRVPDIDKEEAVLGAQPSYGLLWRCIDTNEFAGKTFMDNVTGINEQTMEMINRGDELAKRVGSKRLAAVNELRRVTGTPARGFKVDEFLKGNLRVKISLGLRPNKFRDQSTGELRDSGEMVNKRLKYISIDAPTSAR